MTELKVNRSIQFVSLDTHPANNALVLTYEVLVSVQRPSDRRELARRSKRDQLQINISELDSLKEQDLRDGKLALDLEQLSAEIVHRCPLLLSEHHNLEDIQLHLLYLINRRQSQLLSARERPPSAISARLRSARLLNSSSQPTPPAGTERSVAQDVYTYLRSRETDEVECWYSERDIFVAQLDEHLCLAEGAISKLCKEKTADASRLDFYLEGLYGETSERLVSMLAIRQLCKSEESLLEISANRLLVCAMLRTLRDCHEVNLRESILYCLMRLTWFTDIHERLFADKSSSSIDLVKIVSDMLADQTKTLTAAHELPQRYYSLGALLTITLNLIELQPTGALPVERRLLAPGEEPLVEQLVELLQASSRYLATDVRLLTKPERPLRLLTFSLTILRYLSIFKEFIGRVAKQRIFHESLVNLLNALQLARSGGGEPDAHLSADKQLLNELYRVEMELLRLINNLLFQRQLKLRLLKRNLLKCVLCNLVLYLASRQSDTLTPFDCSTVLKVPLKALYELSCELEVRKELSKSRIIMKCLLEYLLSASRDLLSELELAQLKVAGRVGMESPDELADQVVLEADRASHYIIALWVNLSAREWPDALEEPSAREYVHLSIRLLRAVLCSTPGESSLSHKLKVYLHLKLLRNLTQFWPSTEPRVAARWSEALVELADGLLASDEQDTLLSTECLSVASNLIRVLARSTATGVSWLEAPAASSSLVARLFQLETSEELATAENDDLLLAAVTFLGSLASQWEICEQISGANSADWPISGQIISASNFILSSRTSDREIIVCSLCTLGQLSKHLAFLDVLRIQHEATESLVDKLTGLMLSGERPLGELAVELLSRLCQLEASEPDVGGSCERRQIIYKKRFAGYNGKWLAAIRLSRRDHCAPPPAGTGGGVDGTVDDMIDGGHSSPAAEDVEGRREQVYAGDEPQLTDDDDLDQLRAFEEPRASGVGGLPESRRAAESCDEYEEDEDENGEDDEEEGEDIEEELEAPDLNVIDANSMIKHLTACHSFWTQPGTGSGNGDCG